MSRDRWALTGVAGVAAIAVLLTVLVRTSPPTAATGTGSAALIPVIDLAVPAGFRLYTFTFG